MSQFGKIPREILPQILEDMAIVWRADAQVSDAEEERFRYDCGIFEYEPPFPGTPEYEKLRREWEVEQAYKIREQEIL